MKIGNIDINAEWLAKKTEAEAIEYYMKKWGGEKPHPAFGRRNEDQRIQFIKNMYKMAKDEVNKTALIGETGPEKVVEPKGAEVVVVKGGNKKGAAE